MKSLAQLKRDAKTGKIKTRCIYFCGESVSDKTPDRITGIRPLVDSNSNGIFFQNANGEKSELWIDRASLVEYNDNTIVVHYPGYRKPTPGEQRILDEYEQYKIENPDHSYWSMIGFFEKRNAAYLTGHEEQKGLKLDFNQRNAGSPEIIRDKSIPGKIMNIYLIEKDA